MSSRLFLLSAIFILVGCIIITVSCSEDNNPVVETSNDYLSATVNGVSFKSNIGAFASIISNMGNTYIELSGVGIFQGDTLGVSLFFQNVSIGTYNLDGSTDSSIGLLYYFVANKSYVSDNGNGSGSVTITSFANSKIIGTFDFIAFTANGEDSITVSNGIFDISLIGQ